LNSNVEPVVRYGTHIRKLCVLSSTRCDDPLTNFWR
jgi:hypothetical protein